MHAVKKDYFLVSIIGVLFGLLLLPILKNINLAFLQPNFKTAVILVVAFAALANVALFIASFIGKKIPVVFQFAKFGAVGALNSLIDWGILNILIFFTGIAAGIGYALFKGFSFIVANINSYYWNRLWIFSSTEKSQVKEFGQFLAVSILGLVINIGLASLIVNVINPPGGMTPERWANVGAAAATIVSLVWNFVGYKFIVFKKVEVAAYIPK